MTPQRMIEILSEVSNIPKEDLSSDTVITVLSCDALTAMTRAVEEETARLRERVVSLEDELFEKDNNPNYKSDLARLRQCEAIVRMVAKSGWPDEPRKLARQWVRENPE